jgi:hypothetical protein
MEWKYYWRNVVKRYHVMIEGWPDKIPFRNLSDASSPLPDLENLLRKWRNGKIYWKKLTENEINALDLERNAQIENGELDAPVPRRRRSDYGKKRPRNMDGGVTQKKKHCKSRKEVDDDSGIDSGEDQPPAAVGTSLDHSTLEEPVLPIPQTPAVVPSVPPSPTLEPVFPAPETPAVVAPVPLPPTLEQPVSPPPVSFIPIDPSLLDAAVTPTPHSGARNPTAAAPPA